MKFVENEVYLGDVISSQGMEDSVLLTIEKIKPKINGAMYEAKAIIEDFRMQAMGGDGRSLGSMGNSCHPIPLSKLWQLDWNRKENIQ